MHCTWTEPHTGAYSIVHMTGSVAAETVDIPARSTMRAKRNFIEKWVRKVSIYRMTSIYRNRDKKRKIHSKYLEWIFRDTDYAFLEPKNDLILANTPVAFFSANAFTSAISVFAIASFAFSTASDMPVFPSPSTSLPMSS
jgi:hypothetical protein